MLAVPLRLRDIPMGVLAAINSTSHALRDEHVTYLSILGSFASGALEMARLAEEGRYSLIASERERIAAKMHDGIAQSLFGVSLGLESCKKLAIRDPGAVGGRLEELQAQLSASMSELRRYIYDLRPAKLRELGLPDAIRCWIKEITPSSGLRATAPPKVLVLTSYDDDAEILGALDAGASDYLMEDVSPAVLVEAIRTMADGTAALDAGVASRAFGLLD